MNNKLLTTLACSVLFMGLARQRFPEGIKNSNGTSFDASITGNDDEITISVWTNHND